MDRTLVKVLQGRPLNGGVAEGYAMLCPDSIAGWAGVDDKTGKIIERGHLHEGESIKDRILVMSGSKGSVGWSCHFHATKISGTAAAGWILKKVDSRIGVAMVMLGAPAVCDLEEDPFEVIQDNDRVKIDNGIVEIWR
ncbi:MAG: aconitase X swivel domain-containing protein [Bacillota bacterium]|jgi:predicted aconitase with swiveling domain